MKKKYVILSASIIVVLCVAMASWGRLWPRTGVKIVKQPPLQTDIDSIAVWKKERKMAVFSHRRLLKTYHISLGGHPVGPKHFEGDNKTPEGTYHIDGKNPGSGYHKSLGISYPSKRDIEFARKAGKHTGGDVKIHGLPNNWAKEKLARIAADWTLGCIALKNDEVDELYIHCKVGTPIVIMP